MKNEEHNKHIEMRFKKLCNNDSVRLNRFLEMIQYGVIYYLFGTLLAIILNKLFFEFKVNKGFIINYFEFLVQLIITLVVFFYTQKLIKCIPFFFKTDEKFIPYKTNEYNTGGLLLIYTLLFFQKNLIKRFNYIRDNLPSF